MGIFRKTWNWLFSKKEVERYEDIKAKCLKDVPVKYNTGGYVADVEKYVGYIEASKIRREGTKIKGGVNTRLTTPRTNFTPPP